MIIQKIIIGTLAGFAAGLAIGVLNAPESGEETRRKLNQKAEDLKNRVRRFKHTGGQELEELNKIFQNEVQGLHEDVRRRVLDLIQSAKSGASNLKQQMHSN
ncbi:YtxH domain-containing protein [Flavitalea sp.]|nr:YtxH domain-containing protein [Flavitalea sp.]